MRFDLSNLNHSQQLQFTEAVKKCTWIENNYYRVLWDFATKEFLVIKVDYVVKTDNK